MTENEIKAAVEEAPYRARTTTKVRPETTDPKIYGHHTSYANGVVRWWGFDTEEGQQLFLDIHEKELA